MAYRHINAGESIDHVVAGTACTAWEFRLSGGTVICCARAEIVGATVPGLLRGRFACPTDTGAAWAAGDKLYWNDTTKVFTKTVGSNTLCGVAAQAKLSGAATSEIILGQL